jgi:hypothetical protein
MISDWPSSLREINALSEARKVAIYKTLIPDWLLLSALDSSEVKVSLTGILDIEIDCPATSRSVEISVNLKGAGVTDPLLYLHLVDTFNQQIMVLLMVANDLNSPRFDVDLNDHGSSTRLGTIGRNLEAELQSMRAGLAPGQIRSGLRIFKQAVPVFEAFVQRIGHQLYFIEPLMYHNAILFERHGFNYLHGFKEMVRINSEFQRGGELYQRLDGSTPFRIPILRETIRGRSWAIQDGILGHSYTGFQMYKHVNQHSRIDTFPNAKW